MSAVAAGNSNGASSSPGGRAIAAIDVGSSSVRLCIAQAGPDGSYVPLETLTVPLRLGADIFTKGRFKSFLIQKRCSDITEKAVGVLKHGDLVLDVLRQVERNPLRAGLAVPFGVGVYEGAIPWRNCAFVASGAGRSTGWARTPLSSRPQASWRTSKGSLSLGEGQAGRVAGRPRTR